jgi:Phosphate-selective porin O and P
MRSKNRFRVRLLQLATSSIVWTASNSLHAQFAPQPIPAGLPSNESQPYQATPYYEPNPGYLVPTNFGAVPAATEQFPVASQLAFDPVTDAAIDPSSKINGGSEASPLDKPKTLEQRFEDLEKTYKKDKESAAKKKEEETKKKEEEAAKKKEDEAKKKAEDAKKEKKWFEKYTIRGYAQVRYNEILSREDLSAAPQYVGDRSVSENQTFFLRRARLIISGDVSEHLGIYLQPDFASTPDGSIGGIHFAQIRDWYGDVYLEKTKTHRVRVGQSKIPYGWENLQSSSNRLVLDRNDALNSAVRNERDFGVIYYWTPEPAQEFFTSILDKGLKGSGNYGVFGFGAYAGQGGSLSEQNDNVHIVSRFTLPIELCDGQCAEVGLQGYTGRYVVGGSTINPPGAPPAAIPLGTFDSGDRRGIQDERVAWTGVWYPQPLGFQTEWTVGRGPGLNAAQTAVEERSLYGGYAMTMYQHKTACHGTVIPFLRWNYFKGGYKSERNAPFSLIDEWEMGFEWQFNKQVELVTQYTLTDRTNTTAINSSTVTSYRQFEGDMLRTQFQFNY